MSDVIETLTPQGAQLLREVRDHLLSHPDEFDWNNWCGSQCCIAGHIVKRVAHTLSRDDSRWCSMDFLARRSLGFLLSEPTRELFYFYEEGTRYNTTAAGIAINRFLTAYGYPLVVVAEVPVMERELCLV